MSHPEPTGVTLLAPVPVSPAPVPSTPANPHTDPANPYTAPVPLTLANLHTAPSDSRTAPAASHTAPVLTDPDPTPPAPANPIPHTAPVPPARSNPHTAPANLRMALFSSHTAPAALVTDPAPRAPANLPRPQQSIKNNPRSQRRTQKKLLTGQYISGAHGKLVENQRGPQFRKVRERLYGVVLGSEGYNKYKVRFGNGEEKVCSPQALKIEKQPSNVPLAKFMPAITNGENVFAIEANDAEEDDDILLTSSTSAQEICDTTDTLIFANNVGTAADANNTTNTAGEVKCCILCFFLSFASV